MNESELQDKFWSGMIKLTVGQQIERLQKKGGELEDPSLCLHTDTQDLRTQGNGSPEGRAEVQKQYQDSVPLHFSLLL